LVSETIQTMTAEKRKLLAKAQQESKKPQPQIVNKAGFISLNSQKGSARTFTEAEGNQMFNYDTEDQGTMVVHSGVSAESSGMPGGSDSGSATVVIKDTESDVGEDALGLVGQTVVIKDVPNAAVPVVIKD